MPSGDTWITGGVEVLVVVVLYHLVSEGKLAIRSALFIGLGLIAIGVLRNRIAENAMQTRTALETAALLCVVGLVCWFAVGYFQRTRAGDLPDGPLTWRLVKVPVNIPDARLSKSPRGWADGLGSWDDFLVHNLWANRPTTKNDFAKWQSELDKTIAEIVEWMNTAEMPYLDVKSVKVLGDVSDRTNPVEHQNPALNRQLSWLAIRRDRIAAVVNRYRPPHVPQARFEVYDDDPRCLHPGINRWGVRFLTRGLILRNVGERDAENMKVEITASRPDPSHIGPMGLVLAPQNIEANRDGHLFRFSLARNADIRVGVFGVFENDIQHFVLFHLVRDQETRIPALPANESYELDLRISGTGFEAFDRTLRIGVDQNYLPLLQIVANR